jgi:hypothetical protein
MKTIQISSLLPKFVLMAAHHYKRHALRSVSYRRIKRERIALRFANKKKWRRHLFHYLFLSQINCDGKEGKGKRARKREERVNGKGMEGKGREGKGREGKGREGNGREG